MRWHDEESFNMHERNTTRWPVGGYVSLTLAMMGIGLAMGTGLPALALGLTGRGWGPSEVGLGVALLALGQVLALPVALRALAGGRARRVLGMGLAVTALGLLSWAWLLPAEGGGAGWLALSVLLTGVSLGVVFNVSETWVHELVPASQRGRWVAVHCTLFTLAQLAGPLLLQWAGQGPGLSVAAALVGLMATGLVGLPPKMAAVPEADPSEGASTGGVKGLVMLCGAAPATLWATALFALFDTVVLSLLPLYLQQQGFGLAAALTSASVVLLGDVLLEVPVGWWADRWGVGRVQAACAVVLAASALAMPWALPWGPSIAWWALMAVLGAAAGGIYVVSLTACGHQFQGRALARMTALLGAAWGVASCVGPVVAGQALGWGGAWSLPALLMAGAVLLGAGLWWEGRPGASALRRQCQERPIP